MNEEGENEGEEKVIEIVQGPSDEGLNCSSGCMNGKGEMHRSG